MGVTTGDRILINGPPMFVLLNLAKRNGDSFEKTEINEYKGGIKIANIEPKNNKIATM